MEVVPGGDPEYTSSLVGSSIQDTSWWGGAIWRGGANCPEYDYRYSKLLHIFTRVSNDR